VDALIRIRRICRSHSGAGALGFRDFSGLLAAKENRNGSRQTLLPMDFNAENRGSLAQNGTRLNFASTASQLGHDVP
jgi:hypothetical protein